jgi:hypothetical protein
MADEQKVVVEDRDDDAILAGPTGAGTPGCREHVRLVILRVLRFVCVGHRDLSMV